MTNFRNAISCIFCKYLIEIPAKDKPDLSNAIYLCKKHNKIFIDRTEPEVDGTICDDFEQ